MKVLDFIVLMLSMLVCILSCAKGDYITALWAFVAEIYILRAIMSYQ